MSDYPAAKPPSDVVVVPPSSGYPPQDPNKYKPKPDPVTEEPSDDNPPSEHSDNPAEGVVFNATVPNTIRNTRQMYPNWEETNTYGGSKYLPRNGLNGTGFIVRDVSMDDQLKRAASNGWAKAQEYWGFRFHFNPSGFGESFSPPAGLDWAGFLQDIAFNPMLIQGHQGNSQISFKILLARMEDQKILLREDWKSFYDITVMGQDDRQEILEYGTQYDIERFFRVVNLDPVMTWRGRTSDWGQMMAIPVMVFLGDSVGSRKFRAQIHSFNITHQLYTPGMVPVYSQIDITMSRIPDPYSGEIAESTTPGTPSTEQPVEEPYPPGDPRNPVRVNPIPVPGGPSAVANANIKLASEIFVKSYPQHDWKWTESDWNAILNIWYKESSWNHKAHNKKSSTYNGSPGTGAYGIPQAMPGTKMKSEGNDWLTNPVPQIHWGFKYIKQRYGTPEKAWKFWQSHKWY